MITNLYIEVSFLCKNCYFLLLFCYKSNNFVTFQKKSYISLFYNKNIFQKKLYFLTICYKSNKKC
uniref:Uncharacterized protein n=1 Tax=viral metagenome TaxID=1070528 RepID=A0A6C0L0I8_9ZZZZ